MFSREGIFPPTKSESNMVGYIRQQVSYKFEWIEEEDADLSWMTDEDLAEVRNGQVECLILSLEVNGEPVDSLGGIVIYVDHRGDVDRLRYEMEMLEENGIEID